MQKRVNSGVLRKNEKKEGVENRPDYKGQLNVGGVQYWVAGWNKSNENGSYVSLSVEPVVGSRGDPDTTTDIEKVIPF